MKQSVCPVCNKKSGGFFLKAYSSHGKSTLNEKEMFTYDACSQCAAVYITGLKINKQYYNIYYTSLTAYYSNPILHAIEKIIESMSLSRKEKVIRSYIVKKNKKIRVLDIGCGNGNFLASLPKEIYDRYGIEIDGEEYKKSKTKGFTVYNEDILTKNFHGKKFDVITLWHVIEHIPDPNALLKKIYEILAIDGVLIFATPNTASMGFVKSREHWFHIDAPRHLILFQDKTVATLSEKNSFRIINKQSEAFEFPLDLFWSLKKTLTGLTPSQYLMYPFLKQKAQETRIYVLQKRT